MEVKLRGLPKSGCIIGPAGRCSPMDLVILSQTTSLLAVSVLQTAIYLHSCPKDWMQRKHDGSNE